MKHPMATFAALIAFISVGAMAQQHPSEPDGAQTDKTFNDLDRDLNGVLDKEELNAGSVDADLDELDQDSDGEVNRNEYFQYQRQQGQPDL